MIVVTSRAAIRFERRWSDYLEVLDGGTPEVVGINQPRLPDVRDAVAKELEVPSPQWEAADQALNRAWVADTLGWRRRLLKFLGPLSRKRQDGFAGLVDAGCQPDMLAFQFWEAARADQYEMDRERLLTDLAALDKLASEAVTALRAFANRRADFDEYLVARRLRAIEGESGDSEVKILLLDLEDVVARHARDNQMLRRVLDRRRESLLGHAEVRLSNRIHEVTGAYHDTAVENILEGIRAALGQPGRAAGALKKRRKRWREQLERGDSGQTE